MTSQNTERILSDALELPPIERADLIEQLLSSFEFPERNTIDELWAKEAEDRIDAYDRGEFTARSAKEVFDRIERK